MIRAEPESKDSESKLSKVHIISAFNRKLSYYL